MPVFASHGPTRGHPFMPSASAPGELTAAARRYGVKPMPSLEWNAQVERETAHLYERVQAVVPPVEWPFFAPVREGDQRPEEGAQRRHPGAQLPDAGDLQLRCRFRRQLAAARHRGDQDQGADHRAGRRALHGRDLEDPEPGQDRADPGRARGLLARLLDHRRGRAAAARPVPGRADRRLRQHVGRREGRGRHLLHLGQRRAGGGEPQRREGHLPARPVSGELRRLADQGEDHRLERRVRGARALHGGRAGEISRCRSVGADHRASRMPARRDRGGRLHRLDQGHDRLGAQEQAEARRDGHRMLDGRQREGGTARRRLSSSRAISART